MSDTHFLICTERSGSNLITKMFNSHPLVCGPSPCHLVESIVEQLWRYGDLTEDENWGRLVVDSADIFNTKLGEWQTTITADELQQNVTPRSFAAIVRYIYHKEADTQQKSTLFIKERRIYRYAPFLLTTFPHARYVYLVRDPRDMALSWQHARWRPGGLKNGSTVWQADQAGSIQLYSWLQAQNQAMLVRYEDLLQWPMVELKRLCRFLDLPYTPEMMAFHRDPLTHKNSYANSAWDNLRQPLLTQNFGKYKTVLSKTEIQYIETICREEMEFLGYRPIHEPVANPTTLEPHLRPAPNHDLSATPAREKKLREARSTVLARIVGNVAL